MSINQAMKSLTIVTMTALTLAACGSSTTKTQDPNSTAGTTTGSTGTDTGTTTGTIGTNPADPNGASVLSTNSPVFAVTSNGNIALPYAIFAQNANATDPNLMYGIQFSDFDPCTQGSQYGWNTLPGDKTFSVLGFYIPGAPAAQAYSVGTSAGMIQDANGALGENFTAQAADANGAIACKAATWDQLSGGTVTLTSVSGNTLTGTLSITLGDGATVVGNFQTGSCSATATGAVANPNSAGQCTSEK